jgi:signal transduction histidine kinase
MKVELAAPPIVRDREYCVGAPTDQVALVDSQGTILAVNKNWLDLAEITGTAFESIGPGVNYLEVCRRSSGSTSDARKALNGIRSVLRNDVQAFTLDYGVHLPSGEARFRMTATPFHFGDARIVIAHTNVTDMKVSNEITSKRMQQFAHRLMHAHEEERERIAREIHDDLGARIASLSLLVHRIISKHKNRSDARVRELDAVNEGIAELARALRDLSHGLHPPLLRHAGICVALKQLCAEFGKMCGMQVGAVVPNEVPGISDEVALSIYRISQECLQNIAKHSGAEKATVILEQTCGQLSLKISDTGRGFIQSDTAEKGGLGLISIQERVLGLKGQLEICSALGVGTQVRVRIPILVN